VTASERVAANEAMFRQLNERLADLLDELGADADNFEIFCECGDDSCVERITIQRDVYEQARKHPDRFIVVAEHVVPGLERAVVEAPGFRVIEKHPAEAAIARATDPRA
jgi:hypothetical protein